MHKKLTITLEESVYNKLYLLIGRGNISRFIESLIKPHLIADNLEEAYRVMAMDEEREREALEWSEGTVGDVANETR